MITAHSAEQIWPLSFLFRRSYTMPIIVYSIVNRYLLLRVAGVIVILCVKLSGLKNAQTASKIFPCFSVRMFFLKRLAYESVEGTLCRMNMGQSREGLNRPQNGTFSALLELA